MPFISVSGLSKSYAVGGNASDRAQGSRALARARRDGGHRRRLGRRQEHAAARPRRARLARRGLGPHRQVDLGSLPDEALVAFRNQHVGFVFQFHHLLPEFTRRRERRDAAADRAKSAAECRERATDLLERVGLCRASRAPAGHVVWRRAAARRDRARARDAADAAPRRRAHRRSRRAHRRDAARPAEGDAPRAWPDVGHRDAQSRSSPRRAIACCASKTAG